MSLVVHGCLVRRWLVRTFSTRVSVTVSFARSVWSFFSTCDRASTRPFVDARGTSCVSALGRHPPDTDEIYSTVLRDSSPLNNRNYAWPRGPGPGDTSSWRGAAGIRARQAANPHRHKSRMAFSHGVLVHATLARPGRRTGQRWEPTRAPRQGSKRNEKTEP